ncbi:UvrD-helicase domain-containing protein [Candidatus Peregrinibacteria bacterium]|nr:UvrD-helicase domain-containing protein [Candidatus Peregrinibacteria bacterium]
MHSLSSLNDRQIEAAYYLKGPLLVVAGAGSGKTRVLTHRIAYMIEQGILPRNILAVTFTNKAAQEMRNRVERILQKNVEMPIIGTFHSLGVRILRVEMEKIGRDRNFSIFDATDSESLIKQILKDADIDSSKYKPKGLLKQISSAKNALISADEYAGLVENTYQEVVYRVYKKYEAHLSHSGAVDFDDLISLPVKIFLAEPRILEKYQERWHFLSIDEYQDTNTVQDTMARLLAEKYRNICAIGDSDQAIYSFRGASIQNILNFEKVYPELKVIKLEQNYRSTQNILDAADGVIDHNVSRVKKKMFTEKGSGEGVNILEMRDEREEGEWILRKTEELVRSGKYSRNDMVVLYRTNAQSRVLEEAALRHGIPYQIIGGVKFYARAEIKDIIAYLRFIMNPADTVSFERIINKPSRKIGAVTIQKILAFAAEREMPVGKILAHIQMAEGIFSRSQNTIKKFEGIIEKLRELRPTLSAADFIEYLIKEIDFEAHLRDGTEEGEVRIENVRELISVAQKYSHVPPEESLPLFLEEVALIADLDSLDEEKDALTFMTLHSAKGLEFSVVFVVGCEENVFPHSRSMFDPDDMEEERRLMYVGMTRAKDHLFLLYAHERLLFGSFSANPPSRFLREIPLNAVNFENAPRWMGGTQQNKDEKELSYVSFEDEDALVSCFEKGDIARHPKFGEGKVEDVDGDILTIDFGNGILKRFAASIAPLKKIV